MISNTYVEEKKNISISLKVYKNVYQILLPVTVCLALVFGILSCFPAKEGGNARQIVLILFAVFFCLSLGMIVAERLLERREEYYNYTARSSQYINLSTIIPLAVFVLIVFIPFYIQAITSIKTSSEANQIDFTWFPKEGITFSAYREVFLIGDIIGVTMIQAFINSVIYAIIPTVVGIIVSALSAYGFSKLEFTGKKFVFNFMLFTIMIPGCITMSSSFVLFDNIGWVDTPLPLIVPGCFGSVTCVFFLREYFMGIPNELLEAANIDGAGKIKRFVYIILPVGVPALIAQFILIFISRYNNYMGALIYLSSPEKYTIQLALTFFSGSMRDKDILSAASLMALLPMLFLYIIFQKKILNGISMSSGLKG